MSLPNFIAWPLKELCSTASIFAPPFHRNRFLQGDLWLPSCQFSALLFLAFHSRSFSPWHAFSTWLPGHHALFWFSSSPTSSMFPTFFWYLDVGMSLGQVRDLYLLLKAVHLVPYLKTLSMLKYPHAFLHLDLFYKFRSFVAICEMTFLPRCVIIISNWTPTIRTYWLALPPTQIPSTSLPRLNKQRIHSYTYRDKLLESPLFLHFPTSNPSLIPMKAIFQIHPEPCHVSSPALTSSCFKPLTPPTLILTS